MNNFLSKTKNFLFNHKIAVIVVLAVLIVPHIVHFAAVNAGKTKRIMYFQQVGSEKLAKEIRYIPKNDAQNPLENYISELLLGPEIRRARPLFTLGTSLDFCIQKDDVLYVGLSDDAVFQDNEAVEFSRAAELLRKNIKKNFPKIDKIEIFAGKNYVEGTENVQN